MMDAGREIFFARGNIFRQAFFMMDWSIFFLVFTIIFFWPESNYDRLRFPCNYRHAILNCVPGSAACVRDPPGGNTVNVLPPAIILV